MRRKVRNRRWIHFNDNSDKQPEAVSTWEMQMVMMVHNSIPDLIVKPESFPGINVNDIIEVVPLDTRLESFVVQLTEKSTT